MKFRPEIESLRAFSIIAVILYHAAPSLISGGFIGVDIFFVISGFLMTTMIVGKLATESFDLPAFYLGRTRRILPALIVCVLVFYVLDFYFGLNIDDFNRARRAARSAILGFSNFYFYANTGYFDPAASAQVFLHTWSLGIELQFYLIYPLFLVGAKKLFNISPTRTITILLLLSFGISTYSVFADPTGAFYLLPSRFWEFMIGGLLAVKQWSPQKQTHKAALMWTGAAVITAFSLWYDKLPVTFFPGPAALVPCLAAALFIAGGYQLQRHTVAQRALLNPVFAFIGKTSYSLYLWHWPIFVLYRATAFKPVLSLFDTTVCVGLTLFFATLSWRWIETPTRRRLTGMSGTLQAVCLLTALAAYPGATFGLEHISPEKNERQRAYFAGADDRPSEHPTLGDSAAPAFLLLGDSHAAALADCFALLAKEKGVSGKQITHYSPLLHTTRIVREVPYRNETLETQLNSTVYPVVYIAMRWSMYTKGYLTPDAGLSGMRTIDIQYRNDKKSCRGLEALALGLDDTISTLLSNGTKKVYLLTPVPEHAFNIPLSAGKLAAFFDDVYIQKRLGTTTAAYEERNREVLDMLRAAKEKYAAVEIVDIAAPLLLDDGTFAAVGGGKSLYYDDDHLSVYGSMQIKHLFLLEE